MMGQPARGLRTEPGHGSQEAAQVPSPHLGQIPNPCSERAEAASVSGLLGFWKGWRGEDRGGAPMCAGAVQPVPKVLSPKATEEQEVTGPRSPCFEWQIQHQGSACLPSQPSLTKTTGCLFRIRFLPGPSGCLPCPCDRTPTSRLWAGEGLPTPSPPQSTVAGTQARSKGPGSITNARGPAPCRTHSWGADKRPPSWCLLGNWPPALTVLRTSRFLLTSLQGLRPHSTYCGFSGACMVPA